MYQFPAIDKTFDWQALSEKLAPHYQKFNVSQRILLTGHSHQAWPDVAFEGQLQAFEDAATWVDDKWEKAFQQAERVRNGFASQLGDESGEYVLGTNTQELLVRWLSALPLDQKKTIITTDGEFHSMRRLLDRLNETDIQVVKVSHQPIASLAERVAEAIDDDTAAVMMSAVLFQTGRVVPHIETLASQLNSKQVPLLVDMYHASNILPVKLRDWSLEQAFIVGGGYKYCQLGEGNCFLRVPQACNWRPLVTGWFAEFAELNKVPNSQVSYGLGRWAFEGSTYDPTSHYRAARVLQFFDEMELTPETLYQLYKNQQAYILDSLETYQWPSHVQLPHDDLENIGGFLVFNTPHASELVDRLRGDSIFLDSRGDSLRMGPAPYVSAAQLTKAVERLHYHASQLG